MIVTFPGSSASICSTLAGPGQLGEHLTQILIGLQSIGLGGLHQAVEVGAGLDPFYAVAEQPVLAAHHKGTDRVFGQVVVDGDSPVVQITDQPGPFVLQVVERLADGGFRWRLRQCLVQPSAQFLQQGFGLFLPGGVAGFGGGLLEAALNAVQLLDPGQTLIGPPRLPGLAPLRLDGLIKLASGMRPAAYL